MVDTLFMHDGEAEQGFADWYAEDHPDWSGGRPERFGLTIQGATLVGGASLRLATPGVTVLVGPNNAGKSTILNDLFRHLSQDPVQRRITTSVAVDSIALTKRGSTADLIAWLEDRCHLHRPEPDHLGFEYLGAQVHGLDVERGWQVHSTSLGGLAKIVAMHSTAPMRTASSASVEMRDDASLAPAHPLHRLEDDPSLLEALNRVARTVFGESFVLDDLARNLRLRVGKIGGDAEPMTRMSPEYRKTMASLPTLDAQGDGLRSWLGIALPLITGAYPIVLIDEPEAFLHPPQAFELGRILGTTTTSTNGQVILATHDKNVVRGLMESKCTVSILRVTRNGRVMKVAHLDPELLSSLWSDATLRYTNILDGLFHRLVILCEADNDCQYYAKALERQSDGWRLPASEVLFVPTNGKGGMAKAAKALRAAGVPVTCSVDLDLLNDRVTFRNLVTAMGGHWLDYSSDYDSLRAALCLGSPGVVSCGEFLDRMTAILSATPDAEFTKARAQQVRSELRPSDPWRDLKEKGVAALPSARRAVLEHLLERLDLLGIVLVAEGQLESLAPDVGAAKGPQWIAAALDADAPGNPASQAHVRRLVEWFSIYAASVLKSGATPDDVARAEDARAKDKAEDAASRETADVFGASLAVARQPPMAEGTGSPAGLG
jgi:ABC-type cobalamin/Fe3+-siderophores transport system ATPase subunit